MSSRTSSSKQPDSGAPKPPTWSQIAAFPDKKMLSWHKLKPTVDYREIEKQALDKANDDQVVIDKTTQKAVALHDAQARAAADVAPTTSALEATLRSVDISEPQAPSQAATSSKTIKTRKNRTKKDRKNSQHPTGKQSDQVSTLEDEQKDEAFSHQQDNRKRQEVGFGTNDRYLGQIIWAPFSDLKTEDVEAAEFCERIVSEFDTCLGLPTDAQKELAEINQKLTDQAAKPELKLRQGEAMLADMLQRLSEYLRVRVATTEGDTQGDTKGDTPDEKQKTSLDQDIRQEQVNRLKQVIEFIKSLEAREYLNISKINAVFADFCVSDAYPYPTPSEQPKDKVQRYKFDWFNTLAYRLYNLELITVDVVAQKANDLISSYQPDKEAPPFVCHESILWASKWMIKCHKSLHRAYEQRGTDIIWEEYCDFMHSQLVIYRARHKRALNAMEKIPVLVADRPWAAHVYSLKPATEAMQKYSTKEELKDKYEEELKVVNYASMYIRKGYLDNSQSRPYRFRSPEEEEKQARYFDWFVRDIVQPLRELNKMKDGDEKVMAYAAFQVRARDEAWIAFADYYLGQEEMGKDLVRELGME